MELLQLCIFALIFHIIYKNKRSFNVNKIIISTESGSDLPYKIYEPYNIQIVPLHISFGEKTVYDGTFSPEEINKYFKDSKTLPTTAAVNPRE